MKIAIFGGAFNPVHIEHVNLAKAAIKQLNLDKLIIMPSGTSPHKNGKLMASATDRLNMCRLAFSGMPNAQVCSYEIDKGGVSYTYLTCQYFKSIYPNDELFFIIGGDMLQNFSKWKNPAQILNLVTFAACAREDEKSFNESAKDFKENFNKDLAKVNFVGGNVSSTKVRTLSALGESVLPYVDEKVAQYIQSNGVYLQKNLVKAKELLTEKRWRHTINVAYFAAKNCSLAGVDELSAITAAALHDVAKYLDLSSPYLKGFVPPKDVPQAVLHQFSGEYVARNHFDIEDEDVLNAIKYHTSGRANMSNLEKLIFLADMLEESRNFDGVDELREIFNKDLNECMLCALKHQIDYLNLTGAEIYPLTRQAYDYLQANL